MSVQGAITKVNIYKKDLQAAVTEGQVKCVKVEPQVSGPQVSSEVLSPTRKDWTTLESTLVGFLRDHHLLFLGGVTYLPGETWESMTSMTTSFWRNTDNAGPPLFLLGLSVHKWSIFSSSVTSLLWYTLDSPPQSGERVTALSLVTEWENFNWDRREAGLLSSETYNLWGIH